MKEKIMNNQKNLYIWLLITCLFLGGCATSRNPDDTVDACEFTKPPEESYVEDEGHAGRSFTYPNISTIPNNYSGCVKVWLGDYNSPPNNYFLLYSIQFKEGIAVRIEGYEPNSDDETVKLELICEFDKNHQLMKNARGNCDEYKDFTVIESKKRMLRN